MYKFSVYGFSDKEIEQVCTLTRRWANCDHWLPIDARKFTKQVKEYALNWLLLEKKKGRLYISGNSSFNPRYDLPIEALWRLVSPMIKKDGTAGYSIINDGAWRNLGLAPQNSIHAVERELTEKENILIELSTHHYIDFYMAANCWSIRLNGKKSA